MADRIQFRRDVAANWTSANPILGQGEPGYETDTNSLKIGDGVNEWGVLSYIISEESDPVFTAHTTYDITDGTGFLVNDGAGNWSYDNNTYQLELVSGTNIKTINSQSLLGSGNIELAATETDPVFTAHTTYDITDGTGFLTNDGAGNWSYDNNTYLININSESITDLSDVNSSMTPTDGQVLTYDTINGWQAEDTGASGATLSNDTTTDTTQYLGMARTTSGAWTEAYVADTKLYFNPSTGTLNSTEFNSLSDANYKTNINIITDACNVINNIEGVEFNWKDNGNKSAGVIAQQLEEVLPHLVSTGETEIKTVNYNGIIGYLIECNKEQNKIIQDLTSRIEALEK